MSVYLDPAHTSADESLVASGSSLAPTSPLVAFSVSCWVRFPVIPSTGYQILWWFGDPSVGSTTWVRLELNNNTGVVRLRAGDGYSTIGLASVTGLTVEANQWCLVTFVASHASGVLTHTLYVNGQSASATKTQSAPTMTAFTGFCIGRDGVAGASPTRPANAWVEQVAVWDRSLSEADHDRMFADDVEQAFGGLPRAPTVFTSYPPDLAYWILAGHRRDGLRADNAQTGPDIGELDNAAGSGLDMQIDSGAPRWSAKTPGVFYPEVLPEDPIPPRKAKKRASRLSPQFFFFQKPELFSPWNQAGNEGKHPLYDDPNCFILGRILYGNANGANHEPPIFGDVEYLPASYITNVARRVADWFEFQGFSAGRGSESGGQYEGCCFLQTLGHQEDSGGEGGDEQRRDIESKSAARRAA